MAECPQSPGAWSLDSDVVTRRATWAQRLETVANSHNWAWPILSAAVGALAVTILAAGHRMIDLGTYLLGGAHAFRGDLYHVVYQPTHLGFTSPPFAALWF